MRPKLREIAEIAAVSEATVSRVLNGRPGVADATRRRVLDALAEVGYRDVPPRSGRPVVGILVPELENPIFPALAQAVERELSRRGRLGVVCSSTSETVNEQDYLEHLVRIGAAGIVVVNGRYADPEVGYGAYRALWERTRIPIVLVNGVHGRPPVPAVTVDLAGAALAAVRHLRSLGHRRLGLLVGPRRYGTVTEMIEAFRAETDGTVVETTFTREGGRAGAGMLLDRRVTGIVAANDLMALGAIGATVDRGMRVPGDVSVIGFDGTAAMAVAAPGLTTLRQPVDRIARAAVDLLFDGDPEDGNVLVQRFVADLVAGATTGPAP